ncbi:glycosyltransferase family 2 protein [Algoriphagus hitonicola]|uniref:Glycosyltransferase involved in cell wall bisynthesis n=1 Tax=Algoriphagus hitonicola TaxID=435880 RepID=A0A1I2TII1_9BACT|nr:glycosyltransferase family 2 protein [Algoriphagus hitonicola]SFG63919.1 Glycosyltransferase involved in cell wall bisynthesis [Algoriphagus hitonicola]
MDNLLISILIPNYNKSPYLRETLDSVLNQTYTHWECIIVDDHSTDNSWEILEEYSAKDSRFRLYKRPDDRKPGGNAARNVAIEKAKGEYVAFLDSDDIWKPERLRLAKEFITDNHFSAIYSGAMVSKGNKEVRQFSRPIKDDESIFDFVIREDTFSQTSSLILKNDIAKKILFDEGMKRHQDYDFFIRVHQIIPWEYFENFDVIVNWTRSNFERKNYKDCIPFYKKHFDLSRDNAVKINYIRRIASIAARRNPKENVSSYFYEVLKSENYSFSLKEFMLFKFPNLFFILSKLNSLFKRN